jgi:hypothetical protein
MRDTQGLKDFLFKWGKKNLPSKELLYEYRPFCRDLMFHDEELVRAATGLLEKNITEWSKLKSPIFKFEKSFITKDDLSKRGSWYVDSMRSEAMPMSTSGSTTGHPFSYLRWEPFLYFIEAENHYDLIMDEFKIRNNPEIMYLFKTSRFENEKIVTVSSESDNFMEHHGLKRKANIHYPNWNMIKKDRIKYMNELLEYLKHNEIDVIFASGPSINSMCSIIRSSKLEPFKICKLLSNSNEKIMPNDISLLLGRYVDDVCDHMRCWDGGATFYTCRNHNYHLMDNISWCTEFEQKMICTDYFSLPSPFVKYWNGDLCTISDTYQRCECGKLYRSFQFLQSRPFSVKGKLISEIKSAMISIGIKEVKQVRCSTEFLEIVSNCSVDEKKQNKLKSMFNLNFKFVVEQ